MRGVRVAIGVGIWVAWLAAPSRGFAAGEAARPRVENVVVVTWDGFRPEEFFGGAQDALLDKKAGGVPDVEGLRARYGRGTPEERRAALLPFVWGTMARDGQVFGDRSKGSPTTLTNGKKFSYPGYHELFCGFGDARIDSNAKKENPNASVFEFLDGRPGLRGRVAAFGTWDVFTAILRSDRNGLKVHTAYDAIVDPPLTDRQRFLNDMVGRLPRVWPDNGFDAITLATAREHALRHKPRVLFIGLGETDEWAHARKYDLYLEAAHAADRDLGELWAALQALPEYAGKTALLVTADHGRGVGPEDWTSHGQNTVGAEYLWVALLAPGTAPALGVRSGVATTQSQVAATIADLLGEDFAATDPRIARPLPDARGAAPRSP